MRRISIVLVLLVAFALAVGATACGSTETPESETSTPAAETEETATTPGDADPDPDEALVESTCSLCHSTDRVWAAEYDRAGWETTISRMKNHGLVISDEDYETIVAYLSGE